MHPNAAKELIKSMEHLESLITAGKLPECVQPRFFYCGHKHLYGIRSSTRKCRCIECMCDWETSAEELNGEIVKCPRCRQSNPLNEQGYIDSEHQLIFDITGDHRLAQWECTSCQHVWTSEDGTTCPAYGAVKTTT